MPITKTDALVRAIDTASRLGPASSAGLDGTIDEDILLVAELAEKPKKRSGKVRNQFNNNEYELWNGRKSTFCEPTYFLKAQLLQALTNKPVPCIVVLAYIALRIWLRDVACDAQLVHKARKTPPYNVSLEFGTEVAEPASLDVTRASPWGLQGTQDDHGDWP